MNQPPPAYTKQELASLLAFYAEAGLDFPVSDEPIDHFAATPDTSPTGNTEASSAAPPTRQAAPQQPMAAPATAVIPDTQAIALAETTAAAAADLDQLADAIARFDGCNLKRNARTTVFEGGNRAASIMVIQEAPAREDDAAGIAFQGPHGVLLGAMLSAIGLDSATDIYAGYCVPWCPPGGQQPSALHMQICAPFLRRQIELAAPSHLIVMGNAPAQMLFETRQTILRMRGKWQPVQIGERAIAALPLLPTSILLDEPMLKRNTWLDLLSLRDHLAAAH